MAQYFSTNLKFLREQRGLSQNKLAEKIGVNQTTIARWEDDNRVPTIDNAIDVSEALNIPLSDLLGIDLRFQDTMQKATFERDGMKITIGKDGEITNDDLDEAMAFILEQKKKNKEKE